MKESHPSTGPHLRNPGARAAIAAFLLTFLFILLVYLRTGAPGAWWGDGLELACVAKTLGVAHPTGYPLYTVFGHIVIRVLPLAEAGRALTIMSALFCAGSALLAGMFFRRMLTGENESSGVGAVVASTGLMFVFAFTQTVWEHATFAEVYPLTLLLVVALVFVASTEPVASRVRGGILLMAALWGLAALNHYSIIAMGPLVLLTIISWSHGESPDRWIRRCVVNLLLFIAVSGLFLLGYLYLPLRAARNPPLNWGNPVDLKGLLWSLRGGEFVGRYLMGHESMIGAFFDGLRFWLLTFGRQLLPDRLDVLSLPFGIILGAGGIYGCQRLARRKPALGWGLLLSIVATLCFSIFYQIRDREPYFLPAWPAMFAGWIEVGKIGARRLEATWTGAVASRRLWPLTPAVLGLVILFLHYPEIDKSWDDGPHIWAKGVLDSIPAGSMLLTKQGKDSEILALWYEQIVNNYRTDVTVFGTGFIFQGWYHTYFERAERPTVRVFIRQREPSTKDIFDTGLIGGVIFPNWRDRKIYSTYVDGTFQDQMAPRLVATVLPPSYYAATSYKLSQPSPFIFELNPDPKLEPIIRERFIEIFGEPPPS